MVQEIGETTNEMMKADVKEIENILNRRPSGHYWIVIHYKPIRKTLDTGQQIIMRVVKDYNTEPKNMLGTVVLEVKDGEVVKETVNIHDVPIDWSLIEPHAGLIENPYVQHRSDIAGAYVYNK